MTDSTTRYLSGVGSVGGSLSIAVNVLGYRIQATKRSLAYVRAECGAAVYVQYKEWRRLLRA